MNLKTNKDIIIRVVKNFVGVTAVGAMILLIAMMLFAESIVFSKEVICLLIGIAFLCLGIGGVSSAVLIFFSFCTKKIAKLEKTIADRDKTIADKDKIIANQNNQLKEAKAFVRSYATPKIQKPNTSDTGRGKGIFDEIDDLLSEEVDEDEPIPSESPEQEELPPQESPDNEDA